MSSLSVADLKADDPRKRFRGMKRARRVCLHCVQRRRCSTRVGLCERCYLTAVEDVRDWMHPEFWDEAEWL